MQNKKIIFHTFAAIGLIMTFGAAGAMDINDEEFADKVSMDAIENFDASNSLFRQITDLEQEKVLLQLEKERAGLDLELDRLAAEKIKLHLEIDNLSARGDEQKQELESMRANLAAESAKLEKEKQRQSVDATQDAPVKKTARTPPPEESSEVIIKKYRLVDIIGAGNQLQATLEDLSHGQKKKISAGKIIDGYTIKSISLDDGVVFVKDDITEVLNIGKEK